MKQEKKEVLTINGRRRVALPSLVFVMTVMCCLCLICGDGRASANVVLAPPADKSSLPPLFLVFVQGEQIAAEAYVPVMQLVQENVPFALWVGIPSFPLNTPDPITMVSTLTGAVQNLSDTSGAPETTAVFYGGHSLGGALLQLSIEQVETNTRGQILMGAFLQRDYYDPGHFSIPTLTLGGDLDGLCRVTRMAEGFWHQLVNPSDIYSYQLENYPLIVFEGLSHMQFASGTPPFFVSKYDLQPAITYDEAHSLISGAVADFITYQMNGDEDSLQSITNAVSSTQSLLNPIILSFQEEGYYYLKPPCYNNPPSENCTLGSPWTEYAQRVSRSEFTVRNNVIDCFLSLR